MRKTTFISAFIVVFLLLSCSGKAEFDESLYEVIEGPSLIEKGKIVFDYPASGSKNTRQFYYSPSSGVYRVGNDTMSEYFELRLDGRVTSEGQKLKGTLILSTAGDRTVSDNLLFEVERIDEDGLVWLWNQSSETVVVVASL